MSESREDNPDDEACGAGPGRLKGIFDSEFEQAQLYDTEWSIKININQSGGEREGGMVVVAEKCCATWHDVSGLW